MTHSTDDLPDPPVPREGWARALAARPERVFLVLAIVFGVLFLVLVPPFQAADEFYHFCRAYQVSEGGWLAERAGGTTGGRLPVAIEQAYTVFQPVVTDTTRHLALTDLLQANTVHVDSRAREFVVFSGSAVYSPICYAPQAIGILLARALGLSVLAMMYVARFFALLVWIVLVYLAMRAAPAGKWALFVISLLPMTLASAASVSADSFTYSLVAIAVALSMRFALQDKPLSLTQVLGGSAVALLLASAKPPYSLLFLAFLMVPLARYRESHTSQWLAVSALVASVGLTIGWSSAAQAAFSPAHPEWNVSTVGQLGSIVHHPERYGLALVHTFSGMPLLGLMRELIGQLGLGVKVPLWALVVGWVLIALSLFTVENRLSALPRLVKALAIGVLVLLFALIPTSMYLSFHPVGYESSIWIAGRYFIPLLVALIPLMAMRRRSSYSLPSSGAVALVVAQSAVLASLMPVLLARYYGL